MPKQTWAGKDGMGVQPKKRRNDTPPVDKTESDFAGFT
jgi:hypothetical protein